MDVKNLLTRLILSFKETWKITILTELMITIITILIIKKQDNNNDNKSDWKLMKIILILHLDNTYIIYKIYKYIINI